MLQRWESLRRPTGECGGVPCLEGCRGVEYREKRVLGSCGGCAFGELGEMCLFKVRRANADPRLTTPTLSTRGPVARMTVLDGDDSFGMMVLYWGCAGSDVHCLKSEEQPQSRLAALARMTVLDGG